MTQRLNSKNKLKRLHTLVEKDELEFEFEEDCCITTPTKAEVKARGNDMNRNLPDLTNWGFCWRDAGCASACEVCFGVGTSDYNTCFKWLGNDIAFVNNAYRRCSEGYYTATESSKQFKRNNKGCTKEDECCARITGNQNGMFLDCEPYYSRCNDPCRLHINYLSVHSKTIYDWTSWYGQSVYQEGNLVGGKVCHINLMLAYCVLVPILLNWLFVLKVWSTDLRNHQVSRGTFVFGVTATYPIFLVVKYLCAWRNKEQMKQLKERFERDVATVEGYLESILQVRYYLHITFVHLVSLY